MIFTCLVSLVWSLSLSNLWILVKWFIWLNFLFIYFLPFFLLLCFCVLWWWSGGGFQLSPDFRQRASSNASSCGRLSPIRAQDLEPDWGFPGVDYQNTTMTQALEELTGSMADELTLCTQQQQQGSVPDDCFYLILINVTTPNNLQKKKVTNPFMLFHLRCKNNLLHVLPDTPPIAWHDAELLLIWYVAASY